MSQPLRLDVSDAEVAQGILELLPQILRLLVAEARQHAPSEQLTMPQYKILSRLVVNEYLPSELSRSFDVSLPTMTAVVDKLVKRGFVRRRPDPQDRRMVRLSATPEGCAAFDRFRQRAITRLAKVVAQLQPDEKRQLAGALMGLHRALTLATPLPCSDASAGENAGCN